MMAMQLVRKIATRFMSALLSVALVASPVTAFADVPMHLDAMTAHEGAPCDMPCSDCNKGGMSPSCAAACAGLAASMLSTAALARPAARATRIQPLVNIELTGRDREPDKPPPKLILA